MNEIDIDIQNIKEADLTTYELIDIREDSEIQAWPPLRSCRHVPFSKFPFNIHEFDKAKSYLIFCAAGGRSHVMAEVLNNEGFKALSVNNGIGALNSYLKNLPS